MVKTLLYESIQKAEEIAEIRKQEAAADAKRKQEARDAKRAKQVEIREGYEYLNRLDHQAAAAASQEFFAEVDEDQDVIMEDEDQDFLAEEILGVKISRIERNNTPLPLTALELTRSQVQRYDGFSNTACDWLVVTSFKPSFRSLKTKIVDLFQG